MPKKQVVKAPTLAYVSQDCSLDMHDRCVRECDHCREWTCHCECHAQRMCAAGCGKEVKMIAYQPYCSQECVGKP